MNVGKVQDLVSAALVVSAAEATRSISPGGGGTAASESQAGTQQMAAGARGMDSPAASMDISQQVQAAKESKERHEDLLGDHADEQRMDPETVSYIAQELNKLMSRISARLEFQYHKEINTMSVAMVDRKTGDVLKEMPPEDLIKHMIKSRDWLGAFLDKMA